MHCTVRDQSTQKCVDPGGNQNGGHSSRVVQNIAA